MTRALLRERGILTLHALAEAIAGEKISGSWWGHPKGKLVFNVASALEDEPGVLACKLLGKATFVDEALFPALYRIVTDAAVCANASKSLSREARAIVKRAARPSARVTLDKKTKASLEKTCILHISSEHTASGAHATIARSWESWASKDTKRAAKKLSMDDALRTFDARDAHFARAFRAYAV